jgi:hypothetical protein
MVQRFGELIASVLQNAANLQQTQDSQKEVYSDIPNVTVWRML